MTRRWLLSTAPEIQVPIEFPGLGTRSVSVPFTAPLTNRTQVEIDWNGEEFIATAVTVWMNSPREDLGDLPVLSPTDAERHVGVTADHMREAMKALTPERIGDEVLKYVVWGLLEDATDEDDAAQIFKRYMTQARESISRSDAVALSARAAAGSKYSKVTLEDLEMVAKAVRERDPMQRPYMAVMKMPDRRIGRARAYQLIDQAVDAGLLTKEDLK